MLKLLTVNSKPQDRERGEPSKNSEEKLMQRRQRAVPVHLSGHIHEVRASTVVRYPSSTS